MSWENLRSLRSGTCLVRLQTGEAGEAGFELDAVETGRSSAFHGYRLRLELGEQTYVADDRLSVTEAVRSCALLAAEAGIELLVAGLAQEYEESAMSENTGFGYLAGEQVHVMEGLPRFVVKASGAHPADTAETPAAGDSWLRAELTPRVLEAVGFQQGRDGAWRKQGLEGSATVWSGTSVRHLIATAAVADCLGALAPSRLSEGRGRVWASPQFAGLLREMLLSALPEREREVLRLRQLRSSPLTLTEAGLRLGISRERVRQIEVGANRRIRRFVRPAQLPDELA